MKEFIKKLTSKLQIENLLPPQGFGPEAKTRGGIIVYPAYTYKECVKYWCSMRINPDLMKLGTHGDLR